MRRNESGACREGYFIGILVVLALSLTALSLMPIVSADDMFSSSDTSISEGYLDIEFLIDQDVVNSNDSLYVTVKVMENEWPVQGANVNLTSTLPDNVTITAIEDVTNIDGISQFIIVGYVTEDNTILLNALATYNGYEAAVDSMEVTILFLPDEPIDDAVDDPVPIPITQIEKEVLYIGASTLLLLGLGAIATEVGKYGMLKLVFIPLYSRVKKEEVLDHFVRGQIYGHIISHPGSHYNAIKQELKVTNGTLSHHLRTLEMQGFVKSHRDGTYKRFYPMGVKHSKNKGIRLSDLQLSIIDCLRQAEGMTQSEIALGLGMSQQSISYNLNILVRKDILRFERSGVKKHYFINDELA